MSTTSLFSCKPSLSFQLLLILVLLLAWLGPTCSISCPHGAACEDYPSRSGATDSISRHQALINITYLDSFTHLLRTESIPDAQFGVISRLSNESGMVVHVKMTMLSDRKRCVADEWNDLEEPWIALVDRRTCRGEGLQEALGALRQAVAVVWYSDVEDVDPFGRLLYEININKKHYKDTVDDAVMVFMPRTHGERLARLIDNGTRVHMSIFVGRVEMILLTGGVNTTSMLFLSISFIVLMIISTAWLIFYYIQRFRHAYAKEGVSRKMMSAAKKALAHMPLKTVRGGDELMEPGFDLCVICIDGYRSSDVARILPCKHVFHKQCIDPWLLQQRNCPICKADILKAYGLQVCRSREAAAPTNVDNELVSSSYSDSGPGDVSSRDFDSHGVEIVHFELAHIECHSREGGQASPPPTTSSDHISIPNPRALSTTGDQLGPMDSSNLSPTSGPSIMSNVSHTSRPFSVGDQIDHVSANSAKCLAISDSSLPISTVYDSSKPTVVSAGSSSLSLTPSASDSSWLAVTGKPDDSRTICNPDVSSIRSAAKCCADSSDSCMCIASVTPARNSEPFSTKCGDTSNCSTGTFSPHTDSIMPHRHISAPYVDTSTPLVASARSLEASTTSTVPTMTLSTTSTRSTTSIHPTESATPVERIGLLSNVKDVSDEYSTTDSETDDESSSSINQSCDGIHRSNRSLRS